MKPISLYEFGSSEENLRRFQAPFVEFFRESSPVLDVGCGRGVFLELLAAAGVEAVGVDHSEEAIAACRRKGLQIHGEDARSLLSRSPRRFGGVFCSQVIEHMDYESAMSFLRLCGRSLRPNGRLLLVTPNPEDVAVMGETFWLDPTHVRPYPRRLLNAMLAATGFRVVLERQFLGSLRMIGRRNLPMFLLRRILLGRFYGKPDTLILAEKDRDCPPNAT